MGELTMQCAWCRRVYNQAAICEPPLAAMLPGASHGACPDCAARLLERARDRLRAAGRGDAATLMECRRLRLLLARLRARCAGAKGLSRALRDASALARARSRAILDRYGVREAGTRIGVVFDPSHVPSRKELARGLPHLAVIHLTVVPAAEGQP
jgi:hypothetical protein